MTEAKINLKSVKEVVVKEVETVTLEMDRATAETLFALLYCGVRGGGVHRNRLDSICWALQAAGVITKAIFHDSVDVSGGK
jgi:hypothetical protein